VTSQESPRSSPEARATRALPPRGPRRRHGHGGPRRTEPACEPERSAPHGSPLPAARDDDVSRASPLACPCFLPYTLRPPVPTDLRRGAGRRVTQANAQGPLRPARAARAPGSSPDLAHLTGGATSPDLDAPDRDLFDRAAAERVVPPAESSSTPLACTPSRRVARGRALQTREAGRPAGTPPVFGPRPGRPRGDRRGNGWLDLSAKHVPSRRPAR